MPTLKNVSSNFICLFFLLCITISGFGETDSKAKINGITLEAPPRKINATWVEPILDVHANWVAIIPYSFTPANEPRVYYSTDPNARGWWGEKPVGVKATIEHAKAADLKVMLKPQIWFRRTWASDFKLNTADEWGRWEKDFHRYIMINLEIANQYNVELFCLGTELKYSFNQRPEFWKSLIAEVREKYKGKITIAANWDNFQNITFWDKLDYIGIDAYFPLSKEVNPSVESLVQKWKPLKSRLKKFSDQYQKPIIFCEYGWRSVDQTTWNHWEKENLQNWNFNQDAQAAAFQAAFQSLWQEEWFLGGFLWKWHANHDYAGGMNNKRFTPQNKIAEKAIKDHFKKYMID